MDRLTRFAAHAGIQGCLFSGIVAVILFFGMVRDFRTGQWVVTLPLLLAAVGLTYTIRDFLVDHFSVMRIVMNTVAIAGIALFVWMPKGAGPEPLWFRALAIGFMGTYMGCYFWMLSDERIASI